MDQFLSDPLFWKFLLTYWYDYDGLSIQEKLIFWEVVACLLLQLILLKIQRAFKAFKILFPFQTWRLIYFSEGRLIFSLAVLVVLMWDTIFLCKLRYGDFFKLWLSVPAFSQVSVSYTAVSFFSLTATVISAHFLLSFPVLPVPIHYGSLLVTIMLNSF